MRQLELPLLLDSKMLLNNFIGKKNRQIINFLNKLCAQKESAVIYICGAKSEGKTHLLRGITLKALKQDLDVVYIDFKQKLPSKIINSLEFIDLACLDNIDYLNKEQQQDLFILYNKINQISLKLIISSDTLPNDLMLFKDLKNRLCLTTVLRLQTLNDSLKKIIIQHKINERNLKIESKIWDYLFKYYSRDLSILLSTINKLNKKSLQQKHDITIPFVKQILNI